ncbi:hypothetical protein [Geomicrobium sp. JCM 19055]|nr:hypothetical protein [Geomicrobium sp. JCM 19055]
MIAILIAGGVLIGLGIGLFLDYVSAGLLIGAGIGLIAEYFVQRKA